MKGIKTALMAMATTSIGIFRAVEYERRKICGQKVSRKNT